MEKVTKALGGSFTKDPADLKNGLTKAAKDLIDVAFGTNLLCARFEKTAI